MAQYFSGNFRELGKRRAELTSNLGSGFVSRMACALSLALLLAMSSYAQQPDQQSQDPNTQQQSQPSDAGQAPSPPPAASAPQDQPPSQTPDSAPPPAPAKKPKYAPQDANRPPYAN